MELPRLPGGDLDGAHSLNRIQAIPFGSGRMLHYGDFEQAQSPSFHILNLGFYPYVELPRLPGGDLDGAHSLNRIQAIPIGSGRMLHCGDFEQAQSPSFHILNLGFYPFVELPRLPGGDLDGAHSLNRIQAIPIGSGRMLHCGDFEQAQSPSFHILNLGFYPFVELPRFELGSSESTYWISTCLVSNRIFRTMTCLLTCLSWP